MEETNFFPKSAHIIWLLVCLAVFCFGATVLLKNTAPAEVLAFSTACALGEAVLIFGFLKFGGVIKTANLMLFIGLELILCAFVDLVLLNGLLFLFFTVFAAIIGWEDDNGDELFVVTAAVIILTIAFAAAPLYAITSIYYS